MIDNTTITFKPAEHRLMSVIKLPVAFLVRPDRFFRRDFDYEVEEFLAHSLGDLLENCENWEVHVESRGKPDGNYTVVVDTDISRLCEILAEVWDNVGAVCKSIVRKECDPAHPYDMVQLPYLLLYVVYKEEDNRKSRFCRYIYAMFNGELEILIRVSEPEQPGIEQ